MTIFLDEKQISDFQIVNEIADITIIEVTIHMVHLVQVQIPVVVNTGQFVYPRISMVAHIHHHMDHLLHMGTINEARHLRHIVMEITTDQVLQAHIVMVASLHNQVNDLGIITTTTDLKTELLIRTMIMQHMARLHHTVAIIHLTVHTVLHNDLVKQTDLLHHITTDISTNMDLRWVVVAVGEVLTIMDPTTIMGILNDMVPLHQ
jgi:hypothetical protein